MDKLDKKMAGTRSRSWNTSFSAEEEAMRARTIGAGASWENGIVYWCKDPSVDWKSFEAFLAAIDVIEATSPGCIKFQKVGY